MTKYRIVITPEAEGDLRKIYRYIRARGAPRAALTWLAGARKKIKSLSLSPERGSLAFESGSLDEPIREVRYGTSGRSNYRVLYVIIDRSVFVIHVRHAAQVPFEPES